MTEIKDRVEKDIINLIKKAIMDYNQDPNPECAFDYYVPDIADQILNIKGLAIVDRDAKLPSVFDADENVISALEYKKKLTDWVKEIK